MALTGNYVDGSGVDHPNAYAKVVLSNANYLTERGVGTVLIFHDQAARDMGAAPLENVKYILENDPDPSEPQLFFDYFSIEAIDPLNKNPVANLYTYIKTLSRWQGWVDV